MVDRDRDAIFSLYWTSSYFFFGFFFCWFTLQWIRSRNIIHCDSDLPSRLAMNHAPLCVHKYIWCAFHVSIYISICILERVEKMGTGSYRFCVANKGSNIYINLWFKHTFCTHLRLNTDGWMLCSILHQGRHDTQGHHAVPPLNNSMRIQTAIFI